MSVDVHCYTDRHGRERARLDWTEGGARRTRYMSGHDIHELGMRVAEAVWSVRRGEG